MPTRKWMGWLVLQDDSLHMSILFLLMIVSVKDSKSNAGSKAYYRQRIEALISPAILFC